MSGWLDIVLAGATILGPLLTHRRATKHAARTTWVLDKARELAGFVGTLAANDHTIDIIDRWRQRFAEAVAIAGYDLTDEQEDDALAEARKVFADLAKVAMAVAAARLRTAADDLRSEMGRLGPTIARIKREQDAAKKAWATKHPEEKL